MDQVGSLREWTVYNSSGGFWSSQGTFSNMPFGDAQTVNSGAGVADHDFFAGFIQDPDGEFASPTRRLSSLQGRWQSRRAASFFSLFAARSSAASDASVSRRRDINFS
jgi:hypothetical protein